MSQTDLFPVTIPQKYNILSPMHDASRYHFYTDGGHGWLRVPLEELKELGIEKKISSYSYKDKVFGYLEEDLDLSTFARRCGVTDMNDPRHEEAMRRFWYNCPKTDTSCDDETIFVRKLKRF
jgi:hypothetical protein